MGRVIDASASIWAFGAVPYGICSCKDRSRPSRLRGRTGSEDGIPA
ncbi:hypothetical protein RB213_008587 [Colletotrichum asianum]